MKKSVILLATLGHLVPRPFGVSPVGALALYAGSQGSPKIAWLVPVLPLTAGAVLAGWFDPMVMAFVMAGFGLATLAGRWLLRGSRNYPRYAGAVLSGAAVFYLVSNISMVVTGIYPPTITGVVECYINGLPYLGQAVIADAAYCFVLFGLHAVLEKRQPEVVHA